MLRLIDADALKKQFPVPNNWLDPKQVMVHVTGIWAEIDRMPTVEPEQNENKWNRLMMYLADLQLTYSPGWGANGCGDQKLYDFITGLIEELEGWTDDTN